MKMKMDVVERGRETEKKRKRETDRESVPAVNSCRGIWLNSACCTCRTFLHLLSCMSSLSLLGAIWCSMLIRFIRQCLNFSKAGISSEYVDLNIKCFANISIKFWTFVFILTVYSCMPSVITSKLMFINDNDNDNDNFLLI